MWFLTNTEICTGYLVRITDNSGGKVTITTADGVVYHIDVGWVSAYVVGSSDEVVINNIMIESTDMKNENTYHVSISKEELDKFTGATMEESMYKPTKRDRFNSGYHDGASTKTSSRSISTRCT